METSGSYTSTGADSPSPAPAAEQGATSTSEGADSPVTQPAAAEIVAEVEGAATENAEVEAGEGEPAPKQGHNKSFEERMADIEARNEQKLVELEQKLIQKQQVETPPFSPPEVEAQVQRNILANTARLREIESEISIMGGEVDPALQQEYWQLEEWNQQAKTALFSNQKQRTEWERRNGEQQKHNAFISQINEGIAQAAPLIAQKHSITAEAWSAGEKWFVAERAKNPALAAEYRERGMTDGPFRALDWAAAYVKENMGKAADAVRNKRDGGKLLNVGGGGEGGADGFAAVKSWDDLMAMPSKDINRFAKDHAKRYAEIKSKRFK